MRIKVDDPPSGHAALFDVDDILRCKVLTNEVPAILIDNWLVVEYTLDPRTHGYPDADYWEYEVTLESGTPGLLPAGAAIVNYGQAGDGYVKLTSDESYAPFIDIATHQGAPWTTITTHCRMGNLDGVLGLGAEWGLAAGTDLSDDTTPHIVFSDQQVGLWGVEQTWWDLGGNARGQVDPSADAADVLFWLGPSEAGARFKVLGSGDVWLDTLAISDDLGDFLFSQADGLLLLGPSCEINATEWWSLRRQKATIAGALHQEAGRWLGTRALMVEIGTTNIIPNPSWESAYVTDYDTSGGAATSFVTTHSVFGSRSRRIEAAADNAGYGYVATAGTAGGGTYTWSAYVRGTGAIRLAFYDDVSGYQYGDSITLTGEWIRYSVTKIYGVGSTTRRVYVLQEGAGTADIHTDGWQLEGYSIVTSYCDGSLGSGYTWTGTAHESTSTRAATSVTVPTTDSIVSAEGYVAMWFKVPVWNPSGGFLWCAGDINAEFDAYIDVSGRINVNMNTAAECVSAAGAATVDAWHQVVFNWKVSTDFSELYLDGQLVDTGTSGGNYPTLHTSLGIGCSPPLTAVNNLLGLVGEFVTGKTMLTAAQVAAVYALQRPLVDAGTMDTPGIYILDGQFRMASSLTSARMDLNVAGLTFKDGSGNTLVDLDATDASFTLRSAASGTRMELAAATGLRFYNDADLLVDLDATDASFTLKSAASGTRVELTAAGGLKFYNGSDLLIDLDATDASFTLKSAATGARLEMTPTYIAGYSDATTKEFYIQASDGKAVFGAGAIILAAAGQTIAASTIFENARAIRFLDGAAVIGQFYGIAAVGNDAGYHIVGNPAVANTANSYYECRAGSGQIARIRLDAVGNAGGAGARAYIDIQGNAVNTGTITVAADVTEVAGALNVTGCVADGTCEIFDVDALSVISDIMQWGTGEFDEHGHEHMDMERAHKKYPYMVQQIMVPETKEVTYYDKLGAKADLLYRAVLQLAGRIEELEAH